MGCNERNINVIIRHCLENFNKNTKNFAIPKRDGVFCNRAATITAALPSFSPLYAVVRLSHLCGVPWTFENQSARRLIFLKSRRYV
jgi:hypothetical protein